MTSLSYERVKIYPGPEHLARAAAENLVTLAREAVATRGQFNLALSGGSTPKATYAMLAEEEFAAHVDWRYVHVFWGDERCVPPDHPDSNYYMARQALLDRVPLPASNVHRIQGELDPARAAAAYEQMLRAFFMFPEGEKAEGKAPMAHFDLILLGMGEDGHTASLFPGSAVIGEQRRWVVADYVGKLGAWRVTFTPAIINAATHVIFIVSGPAKAERLRQVLMGPYQPDVLPAQIVCPHPGRLQWLVDAAAAISLRGV